MVNQIRAAYPTFKVPVGDFIEDGWGREQGEAALRQIDGLLRTRSERIVCFDLSSVRRMDASCAREAVANLIRKHLGQRAFFASGEASDNLRENIEPGLLRLGLSLLYRPPAGDYCVLGTRLKSHLGETLDVIESCGVATAKEIAARLAGDLNLPACNNRLRDLVNAGLVLRIEGSADTGGREYMYVSLR